MYPKLGQVLWYGVFAGTGWVGVSLGLAGLVTAAFALVWQVTPGHLYLRAFATLLGVVTTSLIWTARPQMFSFILAALLLFALERYKRSGSRLIYGLPLLTALWANLHGGFAIAFMLLAAYVVGETVNRLTGHTADPTLAWSQIGLLLALGLAGFLAVALNPYGWRMWTYPFLTLNIDILRQAIQEWNSPNFHTPITWPFIGMFLLTVMVMGRSTRPVDWSDLAVVGLWSVWSFFAVRNIGLYGLLTVPALARYSDDALRDYLPLERWGRPQPAFFIRLNWVVLGGLTFLALSYIGLTLRQIPTTLEAQLPAQAVQFIQENHPPGPLFNSYNWGGYLIYKLWPEYPVYIDGRTDLYQDEFIRRYLQVMAADEGWEKTLAEANINLVLIENQSGLDRFMALSPLWREVYREELAVVYVRATNEFGN
jgi:hypothetical protein